MLPAIGRLVSDTFYPEIQLEHGRDTPEVDLSVLPSDLGVPLTWIATDSLGEEGFESLEAGGTSRINRVEADCILTLLTRWYEHEPFRGWLTTQTKHPHGVGRHLHVRRATRSPEEQAFEGAARRHAAAAREGRHGR